jgi:hypothetical protein
MDPGVMAISSSGFHCAMSSSSARLAAANTAAEPPPATCTRSKQTLTNIILTHFLSQKKQAASADKLQVKAAKTLPLVNLPNASKTQSIVGTVLNFIPPLVSQDGAIFLKFYILITISPITFYKKPIGSHLSLTGLQHHTASDHFSIF